MNIFFIWMGVMAVFLVVQVYLLGRKMSEPEKMLRPIEGGLTEEQQQMIAYHKAWMDAVGLKLSTSFQFGKIKVLVFQYQDQPRFFSFFFHQRITASAESYTPELHVLDTSNSGSGNLFPRPGAYLQNLPNMLPHDLWQKHLEGEAELTRKFGLSWVPLGKPYEEIFFEAVRIRMQHNRAQSFWPFRVLCRFFFTRHKNKNKTIAEQFAGYPDHQAAQV